MRDKYQIQPLDGKAHFAIGIASVRCTTDFNVRFVCQDCATKEVRSLSDAPEVLKDTANKLVIEKFTGWSPCVLWAEDRAENVYEEDVLVVKKPIWDAKTVKVVFPYVSFEGLRPLERPNLPKLRDDIDRYIQYWTSGARLGSDEGLVDLPKKFDGSPTGRIYEETRIFPEGCRSVLLNASEVRFPVRGLSLDNRGLVLILAGVSGSLAMYENILTNRRTPRVKPTCGVRFSKELIHNKILWLWISTMTPKRWRDTVQMELGRCYPSIRTESR